MIDSELSPGASAQKIEAFFEQNGIGHSYDRFNERYQAIIRDVSPFSFVDKAIKIYVYTDSSKVYVKSEVYSSYTFL